MSAIFIFFISALLLAGFILIKIWEHKRQKPSLITRILARQDSWMVKLDGYLSGLFYSIWKKIRRRIKFLIFVLLPFILRILIEKAEVFMVESFKKIKDNIRGKYRKFQSSKPSSEYLEKISKVKNSEDENKDL